jgi:hypothetical protein
MQQGKHLVFFACESTLFAKALRNPCKLHDLNNRVSPIFSSRLFKRDRKTSRIPAS